MKKFLSLLFVLLLMLPAAAVAFITGALMLLRASQLTRYSRIIGLSLCAMALFVAGLILSTLQERDKRRFEFQLQQVSDQYRRLCEEENGRRMSSAS